MACFYKAQFHYKEGSVVTQNNDTINGLIDIGNNKRNALKCKFKVNKNSEAIIYQPEDIKAYWFVDGKYYISKKLKQEDAGIIFFYNSGMSIAKGGMAVFGRIGMMNQ